MQLNPLIFQRYSPNTDWFTSSLTITFQFPCPDLLTSPPLTYMTFFMPHDLTQGHLPREAFQKSLRVVCFSFFFLNTEDLGMWSKHDTVFHFLPCLDSRLTSHSKAMECPAARQQTGFPCRTEDAQSCANSNAVNQIQVNSSPPSTRAAAGSHHVGDRSTCLPSCCRPGLLFLLEHGERVEGANQLCSLMFRSV